MVLELDEVRRLTGPNLLSDLPGAIVDVFIEDADKQGVVVCWQQWADQFLQEFGWPIRSFYRLHASGASMAIAAPYDALYTACDLAELAWDCCVAQLQDSDLPDWQSRLSELSGDLQKESNPRLLALIHAAKTNQVTWLTDDDEFSLGTGPTSQTWPIEHLPDADQIDWSKYHSIPTALITGTNGKSTSVRLAAEIGKAAGLNAGVTSTDFIKVGDHIIERGDYSGPGGARMLLRDNRTELAFLEVARGGMLRRGLPIEEVDAVLITNVASDHLGQYGIDTVEQLAQSKFIVAKALPPQSANSGVLVVNADNALVIAQAKGLDHTLCWFSTNEDNVLIQKQLSTGGRAVFVRHGRIIYHSNEMFEDLGAVSEIPMTFNGTAKHNIQNVLGVVGLARALKLTFNAIRAGLQNFGSDADDNPGRGNRYHVGGREIIVDFAHNEHSMRAVVDMVNRMPADNKVVMFGHAGDRSDKDIEDLTNAVVKLQADHYIVAELEPYLRGRALGDIPAIVRRTLGKHNIPDQKFSVTEDPMSGAQLALSMTGSGDVLLLFVLDQRQKVHEWLTTQT